MEITMIIDAVQEYGYSALFFFLWLGIVGMPIPDEVVVMSGGFVTSLGLLSTIGALVVTYAGVVSGLSLGYVIGRFFGEHAIRYLTRKKKLETYLEKSNQLIAKYGKTALIISYFIPVVRHIVPYLVGIHKMPYTQYALYSYSAGFVWTVSLFLAGKYFGNHILLMADGFQKYGYVFMTLIGCFLLIGIFVKRSKNTLNNN
jgi:membrane protein DedA with SNARE-associated domain